MINFENFAYIYLDRKLALPSLYVPFLLLLLVHSLSLFLSFNLSLTCIQIFLHVFTNFPL